MNKSPGYRLHWQGWQRRQLGQPQAVGVLIRSIILQQPKNDTVVADEDGSVTFNPTSNDTDADGDKLTVTQINGPAVTPGKAQDITVPNGVVHVATDGTMTFTPKPNYNGSVELPYTISDGKGGTSSATVHITVNPVDDPSVLKADVGTSPEDIPATGNVLSNDSDIDSTLSRHIHR